MDIIPLCNNSRRIAYAFMVGLVILFVCYLYSNGEIGALQTSLLSQPYVSDVSDSPDHHTKMEQEHIRRKSLLAKYCRGNSSISTVPLNTNIFIVNEKQKIIYCRTGKTGSRTTSTLLYNLEHGYNLTSPHVQKQKQTIPFKMLSRKTYTKEEIALRLSTYHSLLVVRNPLERLASAWADKFVTHLKLRFNDRYKSMLETVSTNDYKQKKRRINNRSAESSQERAQRVPFLAFLRAATENKDEWMDLHWVPISESCAPCKVSYDFIAHTETLAEDLRFFVHEIGETGRDDILPKTQQRKAEMGQLELFEKVPLEDIKRVAIKYKLDYEMFGYSYENDVLRLLKP